MPLNPKRVADVLIESYVNGVADAKLSVEDRGLAYGHGVFETMRVHQGVVIDLQLHLLRLSKSMVALKLGRLSVDQLLDELKPITRQHNECVIKLIVTNGDGRRGYRAVPGGVRHLCLVYATPNYSNVYYEQGVSVTVCQTRLAHQPFLGGIKHLNRLEQVMAMSEWSKEEFQEGLMLNQADHVIEGTMSNLFFYSHGILKTPRLDVYGVAGVKRRRVMETARKIGMKIEFAAVTVPELLRCDEVFLTNSVAGLWPVSKILETEFRVGDVSRRLAQAVNIWRTS